MTWRVRSLKHAVMPIFWLNCIFGMGIFEIPANHPRYVLSILYVLLASTGYFIMLYKGILIFQECFDHRLILFYIVAFVNLIVAACSIILFWCKSQNYNKILKRFSNVDDTLEALGIKRKYDRIFYRVLCYVLIWIACMILLNAMHMMWQWDVVEYLLNLYNCLCFAFPLMINSVVDISFCSLIRCVEVRFQNTNILMNDMVLSANEASVLKIRDQPNSTPVAIVRANYKNNKDMIKHLIQTLRQLHLELTRIAYQINNSFCLQLLLEMAVHFAIVTAVAYNVYIILSNQSSYEVGGEKIIAMLAWGFIYSLKIIAMNNLCTNVSTEAYKAGEIIQTFEVSFLDDELREEIHQFTEQIILNSLNFTAAGFFKINNALTGTFFSTVTTYVVILIQMRAPV